MTVKNYGQAQDAASRLDALLADQAAVTRMELAAVPKLLIEVATRQAALAAAQAGLVARLAAENDGLSPDDRLLTVSEAATRLRVSQDFIYRRSRSLPFIVRQGRRVLCSCRGIDAYLRECRGGALPY